MRLMMTLGMQGDKGITLEPGRAYEVGTDLSPRFAKIVVAQTFGYYLGEDAIPPRDEPAPDGDKSAAKAEKPPVLPKGGKS